MLDSIYRLMHSDLEGPANIGNPKYVTVQELVDTVAAIAGKRISVEWVSGPVGVHSRNLRQCTHLLNWRARFPLVEGIKRTHPWIEEQVQAACQK